MSLTAQTPDSPISLPALSRTSPAWRSLRSALLAACLIWFITCAALGATPRRKQSQDVAEAARQERARKQEQQNNKKHVYTNEDLSRAKILTPEDEARVEAKKNGCADKNNCTPAEKSQHALDANSQKPGPSLGEVARQNRKQKDTQKALNALKPKQAEPFHLPSSEPALASPILPARPAVRQPVAPVIHPGTSSHVMRRDPFAKVPVQPARPVLKSDAQPDVQPNVPPDVRDEVDVIAKPEIGSVFFADVRPVFGRGHRKSLDAPKISWLFLPSRIPVETAQPAAPVELLPAIPAQPVVASPAHAKSFADVKPSAPVSTTRAAHPKAPALAIPAAPVATIEYTQAVPVAPAQPRNLVPVRPIAPDRTNAVEANAPALAEPPAPAATVQPVQPDVVAPRKPGVLLGAVHPVLPKIPAPALPAAPALAKPVAPAAALQPAQPEILAPAKPAPAAPTIQPAQPAPTMSPISATKIVSVKPGDSLWKLAQRNFGSGSLWPAIAAANPSIANPDQIQPGAQLAVPVLTAPISNRGKKNGATIRVRKGDTLWGLAKDKLGRWSAWPCLAAANPEVSDPNRIRDGQQLTIPSACPKVSDSVLPDEK